ncbi:hypothetical protein AK830_g4577 [Neonectria ditissima]|uniref:NAD(P)-binding domain-containing protein n=1 Tax=Neonectria ditissima TaxID=78410 RepID=A0A0P7BNH6_9HYPO|nr:hypothetical protein AK830_g4577 [Neonectria ditissima]
MSTKTVAFIGASFGVGLSALKHTLAAGHKCIALCRTPSRLTDVISPSENPNLQVIQGNAHDLAAVSRCLTKEDGTIVDEIVSTIGGKPILHKLTNDDPHVCGKGMATLLEALAQLRRSGAPGGPPIVVCSSTGMSRFGRDVPVLMMPLYGYLLEVQKADKRVMEDGLVDSGEDFTIVRASLLVNGETDAPVRVGLEDPKIGREVDVIGYTISREDAGKWVAENLVLKREEKYVNKIAVVTY